MFLSRDFHLLLVTWLAAWAVPSGSRVWQNYGTGTDAVWCSRSTWSAVRAAGVLVPCVRIRNRWIHVLVWPPLWHLLIVVSKLRGVGRPVNAGRLISLVSRRTDLIVTGLLSGGLLSVVVLVRYRLTINRAFGRWAESVVR